MDVTSPETSPGSGWRTLGAYLKTRRRTVAAVIGWSVLEALPALLSGALVARALDRGFLAGHPGRGVAWLGALGAAMVLRAFVVRQMLPRLGALVEPLRDQLVTSVVASSLARAVAAPHRTDGAAVSRLTGQVESVRALTSALLRSVRQSGVGLVMALVGLAALAPPAAAVAAVPLLVALVLAVPVLRALGRRQRALILADEAIAGLAADVFGGVRDLTAAGATDRAREWMDERLARYMSAVRASARTGIGTALVLFTGGKLPLLAVMAAAPWLLDRPGMTPGVLVGTMTYLVSGVDPALRSLVGLVATWGVQLGSVLRRLRETGAPPAAEPPPAGRTPAGADVSIEDLTFAYGPAAAPVVSGLTLAVPAGSHLAIVGPSGIGKSTLANLVAGILSPGSGAVRVGGVEVPRADPGWMHRHVALVPQEAYVFTGTVRENVAYLRPDATDAELRDALDAVGGRLLADRLGGLDAALGAGGADLSTGERQLVALARAYVSPASIVLLDEATCHLDPAAEGVAERAFARRPGTVIVIAHRISSALRADRVLLFDGSGTTVGTHRELLLSSPVYADLVGHWEDRPAAALSRAD